MCKYKYACCTLLLHVTPYNTGRTHRNVWLATETQWKTENRADIYFSTWVWLRETIKLRTLTIEAARLADRIDEMVEVFLDWILSAGLMLPVAVADLGGAHPARPPPRSKIFSISCSFSENLTKSYVGVPPRGLAPPPTGNPGSAPVLVIILQ